MMVHYSVNSKGRSFIQGKKYRRKTPSQHNRWHWQFLEADHLIFFGRYNFTPISFGKRNIIKNFQLQHILIFERSQRWSAASEGMLWLVYTFLWSSVMPHDPKHSRLSPTATGTVVSQKQSTSFGSMFGRFQGVVKWVDFIQWTQ